ncbi:InlB B-repeat-containing protein, partial [Bifidobacterium asteroides]|uniref:InlB B-repeat-containing protein n=1 Tax=Bifidobacterium asteroides TaxID=1684 RepID=UPI0020C5A4A1
MRRHSNRQAGPSRAFGILLAIVLLAGLIAGAAAAADAGSGPAASGAATPTTLEGAGGGGSLDSNADSRQPGSPDTATPSDPQTASSPQIATPSSPLPTSSPLSHTTPTPASPTRDTAAQARSSAAWTVSFDTAGGSSIGSQTIPDGSQASRPTPDPSRDGYLFDGWFQDNIAYDFTQPVTGSTTLTARWTSTDTQHWTISPSQGPAAGGTKTTLTPPAQRGIRFSQISLGYIHSAAIGSDGNLYTWGNNQYGQL